MLARRFRADVRFGRHSRKVSGRRILDPTTFAAECGTRLEREADGPDTKAVVDPLIGLSGRGFDEPDVCK